ncbi:MAG: alkaline phosphatase D family protein [Solirubrobacterales bacterium]
MLLSAKRLAPPSLIVVFVLIGSLAVASSAGAKAKGFKYGVTATEVSSNSAILWAKANRSGNVTILASTRSLGGKACARSSGGKGPSLAAGKAKKSHDNTVQVPVGGLQAGKEYRYVFCMGSNAQSDFGTFTTAPKLNKAKTIHFALAGDQDARPLPGGKTPYWNRFGVWNRIRKQNNDFNVLMGDTIYSDTEVPGYGLDDVAVSVKEKWDAYKTNLALRPWVRARGSAAYYAHWDDHEFINDFSRQENSFPYSNDGKALGSTNISGEKLYKNGVKAFRDYNPVTYSPKTGIYRSERWGKNLEIFFLDERSFRSASADTGGVCDTPSGSGTPDVAPTAPQSTRNLFSLIVPALAQPASPECMARINDPNRTMLGSKQLSVFKKAIKASDATFKVIFNEVPIQQYYALPYDRWEGYEAERQEVLHYLDDNVKNAVFLTTDVHANLVNDARFNTLGDAGVQNSGILDITSGPVATENFSGEISGAVGNPGAGPLVQGLFLKPQPPAGVGMQCAATDQFSYAEVKVTKRQLTVDLLDAQNQPVLDTGDTDTPGATPCAQVVIPAE